ncbi:NAD/NADP octopine/nopaline dehydrogenase family protein [Vogesella facilis]|uniref:NAD/NADP octopine/nopaline dehydrogenase family protein n=1 Tax=Vogesella facilis TaxID=1655232 RepID=A0ABV7RCG0_9NEIS
MSPLRVSVLGAGNAGLTAAYHLSREGVEVCLYGAPGFDQQLDAIQCQGGITALAELEGEALQLAGHAALHTLTRSLAAAAAFADILLLPVPSFAQEALFVALLPHLRSGQLICLMPGNYGSLVLRRLQREHGYAALDLTFVDCISIPWATRIVAPAQLAIFGVKRHLPAAALPAGRTRAALARLQPLLPLPLTPLGNVLEAGLENINFGGHPLLTICSMGLLENSGGRFSFYRDCCSPGVARAAEQLDAERLQVGAALGLRLRSELAAMNDLYGTQFDSVLALNRQSDTHSKLHSAPEGPQSRYISEDVPYLLVPCHELARLCGLATPILDACLNLAGAFNQTDYRRHGRTLASMGLAGTPPAALLAALD